MPRPSLHERTCRLLISLSTLCIPPSSSVVCYTRGVHTQTLTSPPAQAKRRLFSRPLCLSSVATTRAGKSCEGRAERDERGSPEFDEASLTLFANRQKRASKAALVLTARSVASRDRRRYCSRACVPACGVHASPPSRQPASPLRYVCRTGGR